mmetsp:Transcript_2115/g.5292  ORF Transcript_2115/g.5292 Transcript_2115/m.5292 type:complete len:225 (-) Transcript_2115:332-1006(-)
MRLAVKIHTRLLLPHGLASAGEVGVGCLGTVRVIQLGNRVGALASDMGDASALVLPVDGAPRTKERIRVHVELAQPLIPILHAWNSLLPHDGGLTLQAQHGLTEPWCRESRPELRPIPRRRALKKTNRRSEREHVHVRIMLVFPKKASYHHAKTQHRQQHRNLREPHVDSTDTCRVSPPKIFDLTDEVLPRSAYRGLKRDSVKLQNKCKSKRVQNQFDICRCPQ